jgi:hypothetical protein
MARGIGYRELASGLRFLPLFSTRHLFTHQSMEMADDAIHRSVSEYRTFGVFFQ